MPHPINCGTYSYTMLSFVEACGHIAANGFGGVYAHSFRTERSGGAPLPVAEARRAFADLGLTPTVAMSGSPNLKVGVDAAVDRYRKLADAGTALGIRWMQDCDVLLDERDAYVDVVRRAADYAESKGMAITMKPHGGFAMTIADLIDIHERVNHPAFGICLDPGNIIYYSVGEHRPETDLAELAPLVTTVIVKDCVIRDGEPDVMIVPGEGLVDFETVFGTLFDAGFDGPFSVEKVPGKSVDELDANFRLALQFIRKQLERCAASGG